MSIQKSKFSVGKGLGKGLGALLPKSDQSEFSPVASVSDIFAMIDVNKIIINPYQPRKDFDQQSINDLSDSIQKHGLIQPITVRKVNDSYELISGERRFRASKQAGLKEIPAYILKIQEDVKMLELALIENIQRVDLNPIETANGYQRLIEECNYTQEQVAERIGRDRTTITNFIRLLKLPLKVQDDLRDGLISAGHARSLLSLVDKELMAIVANEIKSKGLSVRQTERIIKDFQSGRLILEDERIVDVTRKDTDAKFQSIKVFLQDYEEQLRHKFATKVQIKPKDDDSGTINIDFYSKDEFERILSLFSQIKSTHSNEPESK
jgi:ParB family chromosome partitioning protein